jgi:carboxyl-terminal processing protease
MSLSSRRFSLLIVVGLVAGSVLGGLVGGRVQADTERTEDGLWTFGRVLTLIEDQYAGEADAEELVEGAIEGMLRTLDPHSNYLNTEAFNEMRDEQRGRFYGLGIQITKRGPDKPLTIIAPIDGTPAARAGLQSGDIIFEIEGKPTIDLTVQEAVRLLKGDRGTTVDITIHRPGLDEPFQVTIERDEIPIESIRVAYMIDDRTGVVRIANFTTTTVDELDDAVSQLREQGMTRLILDLRGNPGGLLDQAVQVTERFIPEGKLIVYTRGRIPGSNQDFVAKGEERSRIDLPLVVLVDRSSASASEIVSGAVQDHDRGLVVGETTFGKGLVQRVIPLKDGGALAVTTAKYYTPSGRLIQRDFSDLDRYYLERPEGAPEPEGEVEELPLEEREVFRTTSGRKVYGGGGITPDYIVPSPKASPLLFKLVRENLIFDYAVRYVGSHPEIETSVPFDEAALGAFREFVASRETEFVPADFDAIKDDVRLRLRAQIARIRWDQIAEARIVAESDPQMQKALAVFDEAVRLETHARESETAEGARLRAAAASSDAAGATR